MEKEEDYYGKNKKLKIVDFVLGFFGQYFINSTIVGIYIGIGTLFSSLIPNNYTELFFSIFIIPLIIAIIWLNIFIIKIVSISTHI